MMSFLFKQVNFAVSGLPVASVSLFLKHRYSVPKANYSNLLCYWKILKYTIMAYGQHFRMFWNEHKKSKVGVASKVQGNERRKALVYCKALPTKMSLYFRQLKHLFGLSIDQHQNYCAFVGNGELDLLHRPLLQEAEWL